MKTLKHGHFQQIVRLLYSDPSDRKDVLASVTQDVTYTDEHIIDPMDFTTIYLPSGTSNISCTFVMSTKFCALFKATARF